MEKKIIAKRKNIHEAVTNAYVRKIRKWMFCPACQQGKMVINEKSTRWTCKDCGYTLSADVDADNYVFWFCDECKTYLNNQEGFGRDLPHYICKKCGHKNDTTLDNVKNICVDCGEIISDSAGMFCAECQQARKLKRKERWKVAGKVVGGVAVVAGLAYLASQTETDDSTGYVPPSDGDGKEGGGGGMKCANCGNTDESTLWREDDTIYCSRCTHRTSVHTGKDDVVECQYCHRMRDRKALYCRWCGDSTWEPSSQAEFKEVDEILKDMGY